MNLTLYNRLKSSEKLNSHTRHQYERWHEVLKGNAESFGVSMPDIPEFHDYAVSEVQRFLIKQYDANQHIQRALNGEESIEDTARRLGAENKFFHLIPHRKNDKINQEVSALEELLPYADALQRRGMLNLNNGLSTCGMYAAIIGGAVLCCAKMSEEDLDLLAKPTAVAAGGTSLALGLGNWISQAAADPKLIVKGQYIDEKIKELF